MSYTFVSLLASKEKNKTKNIKKNIEKTFFSMVFKDKKNFKNFISMATS